MSALLHSVFFVGLHVVVMIYRNGWGYSYSIVRGEIGGSMEDELLLRKKAFTKDVFINQERKLGDRSYRI